MPVTNDHIREQLAEARRSQVLDAAAGVFAEKGFHRATTKDIAAAAGVSEGTIYNYFDSKGDLLMGMIGRLAQLDRLDAELDRALQGGVREAFLAIVRYRMERIRGNHKILQAVLPEILVNPELRDRFQRQFVQPTATVIEQYMHSRIASGQIRPVDVALTVRLMQGLFVGLLTLRITGDEMLLSEWDRVPDALTRLVFDGLALNGARGEDGPSHS